jgi:hypothetical protein
MISPDMYEVFARSEANRRMYYGKLVSAIEQMRILLALLDMSEGEGQFLDFGLRDRDDTFWIALTRPGMPAGRPTAPRRDLVLIEYLSEWCMGVLYAAKADKIEMDRMYPELHLVKESELLPAGMGYQKRNAGNRLLKALKSIFK